MGTMLRPKHIYELKRRHEIQGETIRNATILIVDDDQEFRSLFKVYLKNLGCKSILEAENGREALKIVRKSKLKPQLAYLDINMPFDGFECCRVIRKDQLLRELDIHLVIITSDMEDKTEVLRFNSGANALLRKPVKFKDVFQSFLDFLQVDLERQVRFIQSSP